MQETYSKIPSKVKYNNCICPNAKLLYGEISLLCYTNGYCYATNKFFGNSLLVFLNSVVMFSPKRIIFLICSSIYPP